MIDAHVTELVFNAMNFLDAVALTALAGLLHAPVMRRVGENGAAVTMGFVLGLVSVMQLESPMTIAPGVIVDLRNLPVALAAAFFGPRALIPALGLALAMRLSIGGAGAAAGAVALCLAAAAGLAWHVLRRGRGVPGWPALAGLGVMISAHLAVFGLLPPDVVPVFLSRSAPTLAALNLLGALTAGAVIARLQARAGATALLGAQALVDPESGLRNARGWSRGLADHDADQDGPASLGALSITLTGLDWVARVHGDEARAALLSRIGRRLSARLRGADIAARLAADRIDVFLPDFGRDDLAALAGTLEHELAKPAEIRGLGRLRIGVRIARAWQPRARGSAAVTGPAGGLAAAPCRGAVPAEPQMAQLFRTADGLISARMQVQKPA